MCAAVVVEQLEVFRWLGRIRRWQASGRLWTCANRGVVGASAWDSASAASTPFPSESTASSTAAAFWDFRESHLRGLPHRSLDPAKCALTLYATGNRARESIRLSLPARNNRPDEAPKRSAGVATKVNSVSRDDLIVGGRDVAGNHYSRRVMTRRRVSIVMVDGKTSKRGVTRWGSRASTPSCTTRRMRARTKYSRFRRGVSAVRREGRPVHVAQCGSAHRAGRTR